MLPHEEAAARVGAVHFREQRDQRVVRLVVVLRDALGAPARRELDEDVGDVIRERAVVLIGLHERAPHHRAEEERERRMHARARCHHCGHEPLVIEQRIDPPVAQHQLRRGQRLFRPARDQTERQLGIIAGERLTNVSVEHGALRYTGDDSLVATATRFPGCSRLL